MANPKGNLYLIPTPLGENEHNYSIPEHNFRIIQTLNIFIVEELKTARRFLKKAGYKTDLETVKFYILNEHTLEEEASEFLSDASDGINIGLLSEAGCPAVADPGSFIVQLAHRKGLKVIPLVGPSSIMMALMASGLNGQGFVFHGYLPVKPDQRKTKLKELDRIVHHQSQTQIFIEAPYRNMQVYEAILSSCSDQSLLCIACNITMPDESIITCSIKEWKKKNYNPGKRPAVFLLGR